MPFVVVFLLLIVIVGQPVKVRVFVTLCAPIVIKSKYEKNTLPLSILYDSEEHEVWHMEGKHDLDEVRRKLEAFIDSSEEFID